MNWPTFVEKQIADTRTMGAYRSSMQVDRQAGRALEVEPILREPPRRGRAGGVAVPGVGQVDWVGEGGGVGVGGARC